MPPMPKPNSAAATAPVTADEMPIISRLLTARNAPVSASGYLSGSARGSRPQAALATADISENRLTVAAAMVGAMPRSIRLAA